MLVQWAVTIRLALIATVGTAMSIGIVSASVAQEYTGRMSFHWGTSHHSAIYAQKYADEIMKRSNGRLKIEVYRVSPGEAADRSPKCVRCQPTAEVIEFSGTTLKLEK